MLKTILSAACASALLAGAAFAQSASSPQDSTVKDPARMEKPGWAAGQSGANTQAYPSQSGTPSAFDKAERKAMDERSGAATMDRSRRTSTSSSSSTMGASAGASSGSLAPECSGIGREEEVTRCLNRHMADLAQRGESPRY
jgi:hypothetical protein